MAEETLADELTQEEMDELDKLAYTHKRYLTPKEIAAYVLVNFGQKNLSQFVDAFREFFMIQFLKLNSTAYANINSSTCRCFEDVIFNRRAISLRRKTLNVPIDLAIRASPFHISPSQ